MTENDIWNDKNLVKILTEGGVAVMPTDTLYGIVGKADDQAVVEKIYTIRNRNPDKPCIILIGSIAELEKFSINLSDEQKNALLKYWSFGSAQGKPEPVSIILDCLDESLEYLHRGTKSLAFRMPASQALRDLLLKVGPLIAPSANLEARPPSETISEAKEYFGNAVDVYVDAGTLNRKASKIIQLHKDGSMGIIRE